MKEFNLKSYKFNQYEYSITSSYGNSADCLHVKKFLFLGYINGDFFNDYCYEENSINPPVPFKNNLGLKYEEPEEL